MLSKLLNVIMVYVVKLHTGIKTFELNYTMKFKKINRLVLSFGRNDKNVNFPCS